MSVDYWDCEPYDYDPYDYDDIGKNYRTCKTVIESIDGIRYRYDRVNNVACVIGIDCDIKEIFIPEKVKSLKNNEWYTVNSIGTSSFAKKSVFTIKFPNTIKEIGESAFRDCKNLKNIEIPKEVKEIRAVGKVVFQQSFSRFVGSICGCG